MIIVGDIVYQKRRSGMVLNSSTIVRTRLGLVIKRLKEKNSVPQYYVKFDQEAPKWYYQHDLHKIKREGE